MVPRERFSLTRDCLEHIYAFTEIPFEMILVDVGCPKVVAEKLDAWQKKHANLKIVRTPEFVYPYEAKNIGVKHLPADTEWVVFIDSDVMVYPHWLTRLLDAAKETSARVLHPLFLFDHQQEVTIHMADGLAKSFRKGGKDVIQPIMNYVGMRITDVPKLTRKESWFLEFHTFMVRRDLLKEMGDFDPVMLSEDVNWSLRLRENNPDEKIIFEPDSVTKYIAGPPFKNYDLPYFRFRWDSTTVDKSNAFCKKRWPQVMDSYWDSKKRWAAFHSSRVHPLFTVKQQWNKLRIETTELLDRARRKAGRLIGV